MSTVDERNSSFQRKALDNGAPSFISSTAICAAWIVCAGVTVDCTGQLPNSFRLRQQEEAFDSSLDVNTKIDLLWVVDNSASMDVAQNKLRQGIEGFAASYLKPTWDIRVAVITTDIYIAKSQFATYRNTMVPGTSNWKSTYIASVIDAGKWSNPSYNPSLVSLDSGDAGTYQKFTSSGIKFNEMLPLWNADYAKLREGIHDGPIPAMCFEKMPLFRLGVTQCAIRDQQIAEDRGISKCLTPGSGESSISQCVNTVLNDTVRSGKAILNTKEDSNVSELFRINVTKGSAGSGSERGLSSLLQLLEDNEVTDTAFFRKNALRGIIFVSDEDDQSLNVPEVADLPSPFTPDTYYSCDQSSLLSMNPTLTAQITGSGGLCCSSGSNNCKFGATGTSCSSKTVGSHTYTLSVCPSSESLIAPSVVKSEVDAFFRSLDESGDAGDPGYFVVSIVAATDSTIQSLQSERTQSENNVNAIKNISIDRGDRYIAFGESVGNGSQVLDIGAADYSVLLDEIGRTIVEKKGAFPLNRAPTSSEEMLVWILHADGTETTVSDSDLLIEDSTVRIVNAEIVLSLQDSDKIVINYQPKRVE